MFTHRFIKCISIGFAVFVMCLLAGCGKKEKNNPAKLELQGSFVRGVALTQDTVVQVLVRGAKQKTLLGGSTTSLVEGARVRLRILQSPEPQMRLCEASNKGTSAKDLAKSIEMKSDAGGSVRFSATVGSIPGVYRLALDTPDFPEVEPVEVVLLGGVEISGNKQDGWVGEALRTPVDVRVESKPGVYCENVPVRFEIHTAPKGTKLDGDAIREVVTGADGRSAVHVALGKKQGGGTIGIRLLGGPFGPEGGRYTLLASFFAVDRYHLIVSVLGGLAIFIFGMRLMSEGLSLVAGDRLRALLNMLTRNRFAAVGVGLSVTGLIQSSSACTVMVIGFVNAGLMQLEQAIGVIMGSNIGTTVTAQMISFKLDTLALPAIAIGVVVSLLAKKSQTRFAAQILIGFGILFMGMGMMSAPLKELKDSVTLKSLFENLACHPIDGVIPIPGVLKAVAAGALLTVIVQSSSASIGLLLALAGAELIDVYTAFAILLGDNIGTTITAILASIGSSRTAKRAACAHCMFNISGTLIMVILFFVPWPSTGHPVFMELVARITDGNPFVGENMPRYLANAHSLFNISCTVLFVGFVGVFAFICRAIIPGEDVDAETRLQRMLDPRLLATPSIAIQQTWAELGLMLGQGRTAHTESFDSILRPDAPDWDALTISISSHENDLDRLQHAATEYLSNISMETLTEKQGLALPRLLHSVNDVERIGDHSMHLLRLAKRIRKRSLPFNPTAIVHMKDMFATIEQLFGHAEYAVGAAATANDTSEVGQKAFLENRDHAETLAKKLKSQEKEFRKAHVDRHEAGECDIRSGVVFLDVLTNLNRVGGHLMNIIEAAD